MEISSFLWSDLRTTRLSRGQVFSATTRGGGRLFSLRLFSVVSPSETARVGSFLYPSDGMLRFHLKGGQLSFPFFAAASFVSFSPPYLDFRV